MRTRFVAVAIAAVTALAAESAWSDLFVSSLVSRAVGKYDVATGGGGIVIPADGGSRTDLAFGPDGMLYVGRGPVSPLGTAVTRHDAISGALRSDFATAPGSGGSLFNYSGHAFGPDGHLYALDSWNSQVLRHDGVTGAYIDTFVAARSGGLGEPHSLAFSADGSTLFISSDLNSGIFRFSAANGAFLGMFGGSRAGQIAVGPDGHLYATHPFEKAVRRYDAASGDLLGVFASTPGMTDPFGLAFGPEGNLYVTSGGDDRIYVFASGTGALLRSFEATDLDLGFLSYLAFSSPVPEPESYALWLAALSVLALRRRRLRRG